MWGCQQLGWQLLVFVKSVGQLLLLYTYTRQEKAHDVVRIKHTGASRSNLFELLISCFMIMKLLTGSFERYDFVVHWIEHQFLFVGKALPETIVNIILCFHSSGSALVPPRLLHAWAKGQCKLHEPQFQLASVEGHLGTQDRCDSVSFQCLLRSDTDWRARQCAEAENILRAIYILED